MNAQNCIDTMKEMEIPSSAAGSSKASAMKTTRHLVVRVVDTLILWQERARQRHHLAALDPDLLKDIGVNRADAWQEANKPFWRP